ncbi:von willebrand factor [Ophiostoma piceae UAMH 11346]|uniref:von willebrand factor n=1 Tax=Ophiostoma piceae (strain UAMH 11346) TaxID=1262450 RepID=S3BR48_OPHP1|nr:von willebrand factor [Ophiostoma piceae UAMH 11346]
MEDDAKAYKVSLRNEHAIGAARSYSVFSGAPSITGKGVQPGDVLRAVCYATEKPLTYHGQESFEISYQYYAFIGELVDNKNGHRQVEIKHPCPVHLGDEMNNGSYVVARCVDGYAIHPPDTIRPKLSPRDTFTVFCADEPARGHSYVVGVAQDIHGGAAVLAAVPYNYGVEFKIQPNFKFYVRLQEGAVGEVMTDYNHAARIAFRGDRRQVSVQENADGGFNLIDSAGSLPTGDGSHPSRPIFPVGPTVGASNAPPPPPPPPNLGAASIEEDDEPDEDENPYDILRQFDTVFVIDDSGSMKGHSWRETRAVLKDITNICTEYDDDGVDIYFLNHRSAQSADMHKGRSSGGYHCVTTESEVFRIFNTVKPQYATPLGRRLHNILHVYLHMLEQHLKRGRESKPLNIIVITDGEPTDNVEDAIVWAATKMDKLDAPGSQVGLQFFQVGDKAKKSIDRMHRNIVKKQIRDIIDTVTWDAKNGKKVLTPEVILQTLIGSFKRRTKDESSDDDN